MEKVFIPKAKKAKPGLALGVILGKNSTKGEVGIEIEIEGKNLPKFEDVPAPWGYKEDHSLRGEENGEYVLTKPIDFDKVPAALTRLWEQFKEYKTKFDDSNRTSVHIHLNCQGFYLNRLAAFCGLYFALEIPLTAFAGDTRVGNLFCLRGVDAPAIVTQLKKFIKTGGQHNIHEAYHYSGLNANALKKFGSLEIRTLRGCSDPQLIQDWVAVFERLYKLSEEIIDPRDVCTMMSSGGGPVAFFNNVLGPMADVVRKGSGMTDSQIADAVYIGIRLAQDLCYCIDWSMYKPMPLKPDPFSRDLKNVAYKLVNFDDGVAVVGAPMGVPIEEEDHDYPESDYPPEYDDEDF